MAKKKRHVRSSTPIEIFYSYSHKDEALRDKLAMHLSVLKRAGFITGWHDRRITAGEEWKGKIDEHLDKAKVILLLVSPYFLDSNYCWDVELKRAMQRHESGEARVIPVILRPCDWKNAPFGRLQALPKDGKAVTTWPNRDSAFANACAGIRDGLFDLGTFKQRRWETLLAPPRAGAVPRKKRARHGRLPLKRKVDVLHGVATPGTPAVTVDSLRKSIDAQLAPVLDSYRERLTPYTQPKIVRDVMWAFNLYQPHELSLIDSPLFQRLRNIFQTSLALFTYPCCVHSRFEHSLGAAAVSSRMLEAIHLRTGRGDPTLAIEARIATLLHDVGHGPFSHSSERFYEGLLDAEGNRIFECLAREEKLFADSSASEVLTYLLVTTPSFQRLWNQIVDMYKSRVQGLAGVELERLASMILGVDEKVKGDKRFYRQIVNGPFDADKLDYLPRDGYFTGLQIVVDIERLLHTVTVAEHEGENDIAVVASGSSVLEQVLFAKTQLYSSVYHHHKVRAAHQLLMRLFRSMMDRGHKPAGQDLRDPSSYVFLDDYDLLHSISDDNELNSIVSRIKGRVLPKRALVIAPPCFDSNDFESRENFDRLFDPKNEVVARQVEAAIVSDLHIKDEEVVLDLPDLPRLGATGQAIVQLGKNGKDNVLLQDIYPAGAWAKAYAGYRKVAYLFTTVPEEKRKKVANAARAALRNLKYPIKLNDTALELAKC